MRKDCEVVRGRPKPKPKPPPPTRREGLYIALGDSISEGIGASAPPRSWVRLFFNHLAASGSGLGIAATNDAKGGTRGHGKPPHDAGSIFGPRSVTR